MISNTFKHKIRVNSTLKTYIAVSKLEKRSLKLDIESTTLSVKKRAKNKLSPFKISINKSLAISKQMIYFCSKQFDKHFFLCVKGCFAKHGIRSFTFTTLVCFTRNLQARKFNAFRIKWGFL